MTVAEESREKRMSFEVSLWNNEENVEGMALFTIADLIIRKDEVHNIKNVLEPRCLLHLASYITIPVKSNH